MSAAPGSGPGQGGAHDSGRRPPPARRVSGVLRAMIGGAQRVFRTLYGESPLHLLTLLASFALCGYAAQRLLENDWFAVAEWFVGAALVHDLLLVPLYGGADWLLHRGLHKAGEVRVELGAGSGADRAEDRGADQVEDRAEDRGADPAAVAAVNHIRVPAFLSLLMLIVYWPLILRKSGPTYRLTTRLTPGVFLGRWLLITAVLFAASALLWAVRRRRARPARNGRRNPPGWDARRDGGSEKPTS